MNISQFADLEIRILHKQATYAVELTINHEQQFGGGSLDPNELRLNGNTPQLQGEQLYEWLFADPPLRERWAEIRGKYPLRRIRLRIDADAPELHALPWELLREAREGHAALDLAAASTTPFSRYIAGTWQSGKPVFRRPLRVLVVIPCPVDLDACNLPSFDALEELSNLEKATNGLDITLTPLPAPCTLSALQQELRKGYHVLHLIAHGIFENEQSVVVMEDENRHCVKVTENEFGEMLARSVMTDQVDEENQLRLVYLDSCETAMRDYRDAFRGFAPALVKAGVPAVIAMQELIEVGTAQAFAATFYAQLLEDGAVDLACNSARGALLTENLPGAAIPVLFMRLEDGLLLGKRGRISGRKGFWPFLIGNIESGKCVPILGPGVLHGIFPSQSYMAEHLAEKYEYPMSDANNLARVSQFVQTTDPEQLIEFVTRTIHHYLRDSLAGTLSDSERRALRQLPIAELLEKLDWSQQVQRTHENEIHHVLARLELPLYLTTNFDSFLVEALRATGKSSVRQVGLRFKFESGTPQFALESPPTSQNPVVLHLNGFQGDAEQEQYMVLSEDDYLQQFARITKQRDSVFPSDVLGILAQSSFLLLGFDLQDWEFRLVVQGLLPTIAQTNKKPHVGIQLDFTGEPHGQSIVEYMELFLKRFNIDVYWGTPQQFINELHNSWINRSDDD